MFGVKNVGILAKGENDDPAAYYGVFPIILSYDNKDYSAAQSGDTMTAPNHRKKGLFTRLAKETYSLADNLGIRLVFGFPNENSFPGFKHKLDWRFSGNMWRFTMKINTIPFCELAGRFAFVSPLYALYSKLRIARYKVAADNVSLTGFNFTNVTGFVKKDMNFFDYKLAKKGVHLVRIGSFEMLIKLETHLYIGEISVFDPSKIKSCIQSINRLARKMGCKKVILTLSSHHWLFEILAQEIEPQESLPIGFYVIDESIDIGKIQFCNADYDTF